MVDMGGFGSAGIAGVFGNGVEEMLMVCGLEVGLQINPYFVRAGFFAPALARGSKTAGLVNKVVAYLDLFLPCNGVLAVFGEGNTVLEFLECLFDGCGWYLWGGCLVFV